MPNRGDAEPQLRRVFGASLFPVRFWLKPSAMPQRNTLRHRE
jgi:hypothetical protein